MTIIEEFKKNPNLTRKEVMELPIMNSHKSGSERLAIRLEDLATMARGADERQVAGILECVGTIILCSKTEKEKYAALERILKMSIKGLE